MCPALRRVKPCRFVAVSMRAKWDSKKARAGVALQRERERAWPLSRAQAHTIIIGRVGRDTRSAAKKKST